MKNRFASRFKALVAALTFALSGLLAYPQALAFPNLKVGNLGTSVPTLDQVVSSGASTVTTISSGTILPSTTSAYNLGSTSLFWNRAFLNYVSSTYITATVVSSTRLYADGMDGNNYVDMNPAARRNAFASYNSPSVITFLPFSDGNNYIRGTNTYFSGTIQDENSGSADWSITAAGAVSSTSLKVNGAGTINRYVEGSASLDFGATAAGTCDSLTIAVTGATDGDGVACGIPNALAASDTYQSFQCFVSAADTVTVKRCNLLNTVTALSNPAAATVKVKVID